MKALILDAEARTANLRETPHPSPAPHEILVKVEAISLNPIDPLYVLHPLAKSGRTIGSDFAGTIASLGSSVPSTSSLKPGDRVAGFLQGACSVNDRPGAFAEFAVIDWDLVWKVPDNVSIEVAAGVSLVALTAAQGMWYRLGLTSPFNFGKEKVLDEHPEWIWNQISASPASNELSFFVYGASTSVGLYAAQMMRLSAEKSGKKLKLFGAASKGKWVWLKQNYGYEDLVDYRDADWPEKVRALTGGEGVLYAYDGISEGSSVERVASTLARSGKMAIVRSRAGGAWKAVTLPAEPIYGAVWEGLGHEVQYQGFTVKQSDAARHFAVEFYKWVGQAVESGKLQPSPVRNMPGSLEGVVSDGFVLLGPGKMEDRGAGRDEEWMRPVSAEKLVYRI